MFLDFLVVPESNFQLVQHVEDETVPSGVQISFTILGQGQIRVVCLEPGQPLVLHELEEYMGPENDLDFVQPQGRDAQAC